MRTTNVQASPADLARLREESGIRSPFFTLTGGSGILSDRSTIRRQTRIILMLRDHVQASIIAC